MVCAYTPENRQHAGDPAIIKSTARPHASHLWLEADLERVAARAAGWRGCDLVWERLQEQALDALRREERAAAARLWRRAWWLAFLRFDRVDPRYATSFANLGLAARLADKEARSRRHYAHALSLWSAAPSWIGSMTIVRRARSSLFHLQMETKHWPSYQESMRHRALTLAREVPAYLEAAARGQQLSYRLHDRWRGEKPAVFDDMRKFLGAAFLIAAEIQKLGETSR